MSYDAIRWAMEQDCGGAHAKMVLVALADFMNQVTGQLNPTIDSLAKAACMSRQGVLNQVEVLAKKGLLFVEHGHRKGNRYTLNMDANKSTELTNPIVHAVDVSGQPDGLDKSTPLTRLVHHVDSNQERTKKEPRKNQEPQTRRKGFDCPIPENVPHPLSEAIEQWRKYKSEKRQTYTETGWNHFLKKAQSYPPSVAVRCIENSIAANYQGVVWPDKDVWQKPNNVASKGPEPDPAGWRDWLNGKRHYISWDDAPQSLRGFFKDAMAEAANE